jgi:hypothetical protein
MFSWLKGAENSAFFRMNNYQKILE